MDRRVQRTRQMLQRAFREIIWEEGVTGRGVWEAEKNFLTMNVQDITERANVNRGTFYLHFADKYMLAETIIREQFHLMLASALPPSPQWNSRTLQLLIQAMLDNFEQKYCHQRHSSLVFVPLLERATHEELTSLLLTWLKQKRCAGETDGFSMPLETIASIVSWTIFGTAIQWSQEEITVSRDQMTEAILHIVMEGTAGC